jgi:hypothetical protein
MWIYRQSKDFSASAEMLDRKAPQAADTARDPSTQLQTARVSGPSRGRFVAAPSRHRRLLVAVAFVVLPVMVAVLLPTGALALSAHAKAHGVNFTLTDARVKSGARTGTSAGVFSGRPFGTGAVVQRVTVTSIAGPVIGTKVTFTIFTANGSITGTGRGRRRINADGTVTTVSARAITGGTGAYRDARGHLTVTGTTAANGITTSHWTGSVRY